MKKIPKTLTVKLKAFEELAKSYPATTGLVITLIGAFASAMFSAALPSKANSTNIPTPEVKVDSRNIPKQEANPVFKIDK